MNKPVIIIGNGGHASVLIEMLQLNDREIIGYTAPNPSKNVLKYLGNDEEIFKYNCKSIELVLGIGTVKASDIRRKIYANLKGKGYNFTTLIHPKAIIANNVKIASGAQIMAGVILQPNVKIGENSIINTGAQLDHDCIVESHVHIAPGVICSGNVIIKEAAHLGTASTVIQSIVVGQQATVGAGAVVTKDVVANAIVVGVPAKEVLK